MRVRFLVTVVALGLFAIRATAQCLYEWRPLGSGVGGTVYALASLNNELFAGGDLTGQVKRWNGLTWLPTSPTLTGPVYALHPYNNQMIAGGSFVQGGGGSPILRNIAKWDGATWLNFGFGFDNSVFALGQLSNGNMLAGGSFTATGDGVQSRRIAQWAAGFAWGQFSQGFSNGGVSSLAIYDGKVIAGGSFTSSFFPVATVYGVAQCVNVPPWGLTWQPMGSGMTGPSGQPKSVKAFAIYNGELIAAGDFANAGGVSCNYIAAWNGSNWRALGTGMNGQVNALGVYNNELIAGGTFTVADSVSCNRIARWDGATWSPLGAGTSGRVFALTVFDGSLIAGGSFSTAGGIDVNSVARWGPPENVGVDSDGDGLLDCWESQDGGIDVDNDGAIDLELYALGARPDQKDLFVEIDSMTGYGPSIATLEPVRAAFASKGISLWLQIEGDQDINHGDWSNVWASFDAIKANRWGTPTQQTAANSANILAAKRLAYRYCIFARRFRAPTGDWTSGGIAEIGGNDLVVTLGDSTWAADFGPSEFPTVQAAVFMHELGHTLGLRHGGGQSDPNNDWRYNCKPNYCSVMNALWHTPVPLHEVAGQPQLDLFRNSWRLDYSGQPLPTLLENSLDESDGVGTDASRFVAIGPTTWPLAPVNIVRMGTPLDLNGNGTDFEIGIGRDLNSFVPAMQHHFDVLDGFDDWQNLTFSFVSSAEAAEGVHLSDDALGEPSRLVRNLILGKAYGDLNCDGKVDGDDIQPFLLALTDANGYAAAHPSCNIYFGDFDHDGVVGLSDIPPFLNRLLSE